jgi:hypothetical protein
MGSRDYDVWSSLAPTNPEQFAVSERRNGRQPESCRGGTRPFPSPFIRLLDSITCVLERSLNFGFVGSAINRVVNKFLIGVTIS